MLSSLSFHLARLFVVLTCILPALGNPVLGVRKEWRSLSNPEKNDYIQAVKCLQKLPSRYGGDQYPGAKTRYDDFVLVHIIHTPNTHSNGHFLPWHRYYVVLFEQALRSECKYKGYQPFWDQSLDLIPNNNFLQSPVFDANHGFGGNGPYVDIPSDFVFFGSDMTPLSLTGQGPVSEARGNAAAQSTLPVLVQLRTGGGCVPDGPFKDLKIRLGPNNGTANNERCLNRDFAPGLFEQFNTAQILQAINASPTYADLLNVIEPVHGTGHVGVGGVLGEMINLFSSPNDPLFFVHHANLDRVWWNWQRGNLDQRLTDISGFASNFGDETVSLDFKMTFSPEESGRAIRDVMDIRQLGFTYAAPASS